MVFPACAGMFRTFRVEATDPGGFPRVRGDVPVVPFDRVGSDPFSPRARGCSVYAPQPPTAPWVFPACAGMFLIEHCFRGIPSSFPRVRGDVPLLGWWCRPRSGFSPRARGCSDLTAQGLGLLEVFPACAGMFRQTTFPVAGTGRFPRVRGDVPDPALTRDDHARFSPRARGCSLVEACLPLIPPVFPACAGMFLPRRENTG